MKVTLKSIKEYRGMSEETICFEATVYVDGKKIGRVSNRGHGGCHEYDFPWAEQKKIEDYAKTLPKETYTMGGKKHSYAKTADSIIDKILCDTLDLKDLKRSMRTKILFVNDKGEIRQTKTIKNLPAMLKTAQQQAKVKADCIAKFKTDKILNFMPEDEALKLYRKEMATA